MSEQSSVVNFSELGVFSFNFKSSLHNAANAQEMLSKPPMVRALRIVNKLLGSNEALLELYGSLVRMYNPNMSREQITACIHDIRKVKLSVVVQTSQMNEGAIITSFLSQGDGPESTTSDRIISFSGNFINYPKGTEDRVCYLHMLKILHEVAYAMTPSFAKRADACAKNTSPENIGMKKEKHGARMDGSCAWEMDRVGGRVHASENLSNPFGKELRLLLLEDAAQASQASNYDEVVLPDAFIAQQLELFDKWKPGQPIPNMKYHPPVQTRSSSSRARELATQSPSSSESSAVPYSSQRKRGQSISTYLPPKLHGRSLHSVEGFVMKKRKLRTARQRRWGRRSSHSCRR